MSFTGTSVDSDIKDAREGFVLTMVRNGYMYMLITETGDGGG